MLRVTDRYTVRVLNGQGEVSELVFNTICNAVEFTVNFHKPDDHMFFTVLGASGMMTDAGAGMGLYHAGVRHIAICGGLPPKELEMSEEEHLYELEMTVFHEMEHYVQDIEGTLGQSEENERLSEEAALFMHNTYKSDGKTSFALTEKA